MGDSTSDRLRRSEAESSAQRAAPRRKIVAVVREDPDRCTDTLLASWENVETTVTLILDRPDLSSTAQYLLR